MTVPSVVSALTIAGSDSGGGAGIQADLKTFAAHRVHGLSAIAALTAQHTRGVTAVNVPPMDFLRAQLDACFEDFDIRAVKLGMLATADVIGAVAEALRAHRPATVVVDPVMVATSGAKLLEDSAGTVDSKFGKQYGDYARSAATTVAGLATTLDKKDLDELAASTRDMVKKNPAIAVGAATVIGFVLARMLKGNSSD